MRILSLVLLCCAIAAAEEYPQFVAMMKMTNAATDALRKMDQKTGPQAMRAAERIGTIYEEMIPFWRQRNATAAVKLSVEGKAAAAELANAAFAGDAAKADAAFNAIMATCKSCHETRREKTSDGKYRIKQPASSQ